MLLQSGLELYNLLQSLLGEQHGTGWACPHCRKLGVYEVENEATSDRLFLSSRLEENRHPLRFVCRKAQAGIVDHLPVFSVEELVETFLGKTLELAPGLTWLSLAGQFRAQVGMAGSTGEWDRDKAFWTFEQVLNMHSDSRTYAEWEKVGFSEEVVDKLHLGIQINGRLTIPIPYYELREDGYVLSPYYVQRTRQAENGTGPKYLWPKGLPASLWYISGEGPVKIVEGDTSTIAALEIWGDGPIATTTSGAGTWSDDMTRYLLAKGHTTFYIYYDNDDAGRSYGQRIYTSFRNVAQDWSQVEVLLVLWPSSEEVGCDPRSILKKYGVEQARRLLEQWVVKNGWFSMRQPSQGRVTANVDKSYLETTWQQEYEIAKAQVTSVEVLRGRGTGSIWSEIDEYVTSYKLDDEGRGQLLLVRSTPGVGKTRTAVRYAEKVALEYKAKRDRWAQRKLAALLAKQNRTEQEEELLEKLTKGQYKKLSVIFAGPFIDGFEDILRHAEHPELWHNLEARNAETCANYPLTQLVVNSGYNIMQTCCIEGGICAMRGQCKKVRDGVLQYLGQLDAVDTAPIVYIRHNHLYMKTLLKKARLLIVDEDPSAVSLDPITLTLADLRKFDPFVMLDTLDADVVARLWEAFLVAVQSWNVEGRMLYGRRLIEAINVQRGPDSLHELASYIQQHDLLISIADWIPENFETAPSGKIVSLLALLVADILRPDENWNGQIFLEQQSIIFYPIDPFPIDLKKPIVALDATGMASKYSLCFSRDVREFRAEVFPANARTVVITDTENTMNTVLSGIGERQEFVVPYGVRDTMTPAKSIDPGQLAVLEDEDLIKNRGLRDIVRLSLGLTEHHGQLLLVTYKTARLFLEKFMYDHFPAYAACMGFGHFKALRGLNIFESLPAVLVAGTPRIPPLVLQRTLIALHKNDPDLLDLSLIRSDEYYHHTPLYYPTLRLADPRTRDFIDELEAGELNQVAGRIRAAVHDDPNNPKYIYMMTARPALRWHSFSAAEEYNSDTDPCFMTTKRATWQLFEAEQTTALVRQYIEQYGAEPSIAKLAEFAGVTEWRARKAMTYWRENYS